MQPAVIELQVERIGQLFDMLDPQPFRERDLDRDAEDYIVGWARELPRGLPLCIRIHMPESEAGSEQAHNLGPAMRRYFAYRADSARREMKELFRLGRIYLLIGLAVLALCIAGGGLLPRLMPNPETARFLNEGLIILGWVANWRPIEIFLYDWWPILRRRRLFVRLASAEIAISAR